MDVQDNTDYSELQKQTMDEINVIMAQIVQIQIESSPTHKLYKQFEYLFVNGQPLKVTDKMIHEIKWLIHYVKETHLYLYEEYKKDMLEKFDRITDYLPHLFDLYDTYTQPDIGARHFFEPVSSLKDIKRLLYPFRDCVNREKFASSFVDHCVFVLEFYKFTANFMRCRLEEYEFDIEFMKKHPESIRDYLVTR